MKHLDTACNNCYWYGKCGAETNEIDCEYYDSLNDDSLDQEIEEIKNAAYKEIFKNMEEV